MRRERGCLVVAAAGNEGDANSTYGSDYGLLSTPGDLKNVLSVGAADKDGNVADFSSVGPLSDLSFGEKVYARGVGVLSADNEGYSRSSGTSFAAPKVSSAAALVMQRLKNIGMSGAELLRQYDRTSGKHLTADCRQAGHHVGNYKCRERS